MYAMEKHFLLTSKCVEDPNFQDKLLDFFNKEVRPVNMALEANVRTLPEEKVEKVYFMHPDNLAKEILEKMKNGRIESASITFEPSTCVMDVCMGKDLELLIHLNAKDYPKK